MNRSLFGAAAAAALFAVSPLAESSGPGFWQSATQADFLKGEIEHLSIDEHGRLMVSEEGRLPVLGQLIEFFPPHCDPTINLYDRIYAMRGSNVEAVWDIAGRGRSQ